MVSNQAEQLLKLDAEFHNLKDLSEMIVVARDGAVVRLKDIAAHVGVSIMTVSKALRAEKDVAAATRERIRDLARQMGYVEKGSADDETRLGERGHRL